MALKLLASYFVPRKKTLFFSKLQISYDYCNLRNDPRAIKTNEIFGKIFREKLLPISIRRYFSEFADNYTTQCIASPNFFTVFETHWQPALPMQMVWSPGLPIVYQNL